MAESEFVPSVQDRFFHILSAINTVQTEFGDFSAKEITNNKTFCLALERLIEIISVASDHIPDEIKTSEVRVDWQCLADIGARLENASERIEPATLMNIAREKLSFLRACAEQRIRT